MKKKQTSEIATSDLLDEQKLYVERAKMALPYLVRQAKAGQTIYYSDLAQEINIPNPRNLNYPLGAIGKALIELGKKNNIEIPPIQCLVINKQNDLPGEGIGWFIDSNDFKELNKSQKQKIINLQLAKIYSFQRWDWVLEQLHIAPIKINIEQELKEAKNGKGGESEHHRRFKEFIANNPQAIGLSPTLSAGKIEYVFPSADTIDVLFIDNTLKIGIEVKSSISNTSDILRGLFQCVKYKSLIEAEQIVCDDSPNSRVILALQGKFPNELSLVKSILGIEVIDEIQII